MVTWVGRIDLHPLPLKNLQYLVLAYLDRGFVVTALIGGIDLISNVVNLDRETTSIISVPSRRRCSILVVNPKVNGTTVTHNHSLVDMGACVASPNNILIVDNKV